MGLQLINQLSPCSPHLTIASIFKKLRFNCKFDISNQISFRLWNVSNVDIASNHLWIYFYRLQF